MRTLLDGRPAVLLACALVACGSRAAPKSATTAACDVERAFPKAPLSSAPEADLSKLPLGRNAFALARVAPFGEHFALYFMLEDYDVCYLRATDAENDADIESCAWGGLAMPPKKIAPLPADVAPLAHALVSRAARSCAGREMQIAFNGAYRALVVYEVIPHDATRGAFGMIVLGADRALTRIVTVRESITSDDGLMSVPKDARWLPLELGDGKTLVTRAIAAARRVDGGAPEALAEAVLAAAREPR